MILNLKIKRLSLRILILIIFVYFIHRIYILANSSLAFYSDDAIYAEMARFWMQRKFDLVFHPTWPPLYPFVSAFSFLFVENWEKATRLVSIISGGLILLPIFFLVKKFTSDIVALLFVLIFSFLEPFIRISLFPQSDMLATLLIVSGVASFVYKKFYIASLFFGLAYLARAEGLFFFAISLPFLISRENIKKIPIYLVIFALTISPYWIAIRVKSGSWSLSQKASAQIKQGHAFEINNESTTWSQEVVSVKNPNYKSEYFKGGLPYVLEYSDWYWFWFKQKTNAWENLLLQNFPVWSIPIIVLGITTFYLPFILSVGIATSIFATPIADIRYLFWAEIVLLVFFFVGIYRLRLPGFIALIALTLFPSFDYKNIFFPQSYAKYFTNTFYHEEIVKGGEWIKNNTSPNTKIMMRHEGVEFYGDAETIYIPQNIELGKVISYGKKFGADYIVAWQEELSSDKNLSKLLVPSFKDKDLLLVFQYPTTNPKLLIFKFK